MKTTVNIANVFPKYLFWDMDYDKLDFRRDKDIIIPRALFVTTFETFNDDIKKLEVLYIHKQIIKVLKFTKGRISNQICLLAAKRYDAQDFLRFSVSFLY